jgi:hypothetical protein
MGIVMPIVLRMDLECSIRSVCSVLWSEVRGMEWNGRLSTTGWSSIIIRRFEKYKLFSITVPIHKTKNMQMLMMTLE